MRLQPQPAQVLALLLAHPGEVVTRETIRSTIWGEGTFVDFDRGLNFCVAQIRSALGDASSSPLYVKTLPKRGYQFIAPNRFADGLTDAVVAEFTGWGGSKYDVIGNVAILRQPRNQRDLLQIHSVLNADFVILGQIQPNSSGIQVLAHLIVLPSQAHLKVARIVISDSDPTRFQPDLARRIVEDFAPRLTLSSKR